MSRALFANPSVVSLTSQLVLQSLRRRFTYITWRDVHVDRSSLPTGVPNSSIGVAMLLAMSIFWGVYSEFSRFPNFIAEAFSTSQSPPTACQFIFSNIHFMSFFTLLVRHRRITMSVGQELTPDTQHVLLH